jgi:hypothetical protein
LLTVLPHDRGRRLQPNADTAALIDKSALGRYPSNDIFSVNTIAILRPP